MVAEKIFLVKYFLQTRKESKVLHLIFCISWGSRFTYSGHAIGHPVDNNYFCLCIFTTSGTCPPTSAISYFSILFVTSKACWVTSWDVYDVRCNCGYQTTAFSTTSLVPEDRSLPNCLRTGMGRFPITGTVNRNWRAM